MKRLIVVMTAVGILLSALSATASMLSVADEEASRGIVGEQEFTPPLPPSAPEGVTAEVESGLAAAGGFSDAAQMAVRLSWIENDPDEGVVEYRVYRADGEDGDFDRVGETDGPAFTDNGVAAGETYVYYVTAVNQVGEGAPSDEASVTLPVDCEALRDSGGDYDAAVEEGDCPPLTPTPSPDGTATGEPGGTPGVEGTATPEPTSTPPPPTPTGTPFTNPTPGTATPHPTATPEVTATPQSTPEPTATPQEDGGSAEPTATPAP